ncbi:MAG: hypothetical protein ACRDOO_24840 [Actinomadura sp.]
MSDPDEKPEPRDPLDVPDTPWWSVAPVTGDTDVDAGTGPGVARDAETGTLVAGPGVPPLDTRGAVPLEPVVPLQDPLPPDSFPSGSDARDTDPDGIPVLGADGGALPPPAAVSGGGDPRRLPVVIGGGAVAVVLLAAIVLAGLKALSGPAQDSAAARSTTPATPRPTAPAAVPDKPASAASIDHERTDPRPLSLREVFPTGRIVVGGHMYKRDMTSVNRQCELTARGAMAAALERGRCRGVLRATFADGTKYAVTTGIAIMPTRTAAVAASRSGDPSRYEWFRGMRGEIATRIDQAGGYASSTVRGRYIIYAYAQYTDGTRPRAADPTLKALADQFVGYTVRPIDQRARA